MKKRSSLMVFNVLFIFSFVIPGFGGNDIVEKYRGILAAGESKAKILVLGTFHFKDAGLDSYKPQHDFDVLSASGQKQVEELVQLLAAFKPTKVAVEWKTKYQEKVNVQFQEYLKGTYKLTSNEVHQVGFRLAKTMGHPQVYLVDAKGRGFTEPGDIDAFAKANGQDIYLKNTWGKRYRKIYKHEDALKMKMRLVDYLQFMNLDEMLEMSHGAYLVDDFAVGKDSEFPGVDGFVTRWYNRNLRIFSNLVRLTESPKERIILIIGAGHVPIIKHAIESSPQFEFVKVSSVLGKN